MNGARKQCRIPTCKFKAVYSVQKWRSEEVEFCCGIHLGSTVKEYGTAIIWELESEQGGH